MLRTKESKITFKISIVRFTTMWTLELFYLFWYTLLPKLFITSHCVLCGIMFYLGISLKCMNTFEVKTVVFLFNFVSNGLSSLNSQGLNRPQTHSKIQVLFSVPIGTQASEACESVDFRFFMSKGYSLVIFKRGVSKLKQSHH